MTKHMLIAFALVTAACVAPDEEGSNGINFGGIGPEFDVEVSATAERAEWNDRQNKAKVVQGEHEIEGADFALSIGDEVIDGVTTSVVTVPGGEILAEFSHKENGLQLIASLETTASGDVQARLRPDFLGVWECTPRYDDGKGGWKDEAAYLQEVTDNGDVFFNQMGWVEPHGNVLRIYETGDRRLLFDDDHMLGVMLGTDHVRFHIDSTGRGHVVTDCYR